MPQRTATRPDHLSGSCGCPRGLKMTAEEDYLAAAGFVVSITFGCRRCQLDICCSGLRREPESSATGPAQRKGARARSAGAQ